MRALPSPDPLRLLTFSAALAAAACGAEPAPAERLGLAPAAIQGGVEDADDTAVMAVVDTAAQQICTGTLIAPNVVLTARHCVAPVENLVDGAVVCDATTFGPNDEPKAFQLSTAAVIDSKNVDEYAVREVVTIAGDDATCGNDVAVLVLTTNVSASVATPLRPRFTAPTKGEGYSAVGYGNTSETGTDAGSRRRIDGLTVDCVGYDCASLVVEPNEWTGATSVCSGDSGSPALDDAGHVLGVASRGSLGCATPIYLALGSVRAWLVDAVVHAADLGGYEPPAWTTEPPPPDPSAPDAGASEPDAGPTDVGGPITHTPAPKSAYGTAPGRDGCAVGGGAGARDAAWAMALVGIAALARRARRAGR